MAISNDPKVVAAALKAVSNESLLKVLDQFLSMVPSLPKVKTPRPIEDAGIHLGAVDGWRLWRVNSYRLKSVTRDAFWLPGVPMTGDPTKEHEGVYAFSDPNDANREFSYNDLNYAFGRVKLWGNVVEHERGYRAEHARIIDLIRGPNLPELRALYLDREFPRLAGLAPVFDSSGLVGVASVTLLERTREISALNPSSTSFEVNPLPRRVAAWYAWYAVEPFRGQPGIALRPGDDPTWLPGWLPLTGDGRWVPTW